MVTVTRILGFYKPQDKGWIPTGCEEVDLQIAESDYAEDDWASVYDAAEQWCKERGYDFEQFLDDSDEI